MRELQRPMGLRMLAVVTLLAPVGLAALAQETSDEYRKAVLAAFRQGNRLQDQGRYAEAIKAYEKARPLAVRVYGPDHPNTAVILNNLAHAHEQLGQYAQAEPLYQRGLKALESRLGANHPVVAGALHNLARLYSATGHYARAEPLSRRCLEIREAGLGKDHPLVAVSLNDLALLYQNQGYPARAKPLYQRSLTIVEAKLGKDHPQAATALNNLALLHQQAGRHARAEALYQRALVIKETAFGKNHLNVATTLNNLAGLYQAMGRYARAEPLFQRARRIRADGLGKAHPLVADSLHNLGALHAEMADYARAESLFRRSREIYEARLGPDHPQVATVLISLAELSHKTGQYARAESLFQRGLKIREERLGRDHPDVATVLNGLAGLYQGLGDYARAEPLYQRCLQIKQARLGQDHPDVATALNNLAVLCQRLGQYEQAEQFLQRSLQIRTARLGKGHPDVAQSLHNLAALYQRLGRYARAEPLYRSQLESAEARLGPDHPSVALTLNGLAALYQEMGQYARAEPLYRRSLQIDEARLGKDHPDTALVLNNLAALYLRLDAPTRALPLLQRSLAIIEKRPGLNQRHLPTYLTNLGMLFATLGRWDEAVEAFERSCRSLRRQVDRVLPSLSEAEQLTFLKTCHEPGLHGALSLALARRDQAGLAARSASWVINGKAVTQQALAERALLARARHDPRLARLARDLSAVRAQLARLAFSNPRSGQEAERQLAEFGEQERRLSRQFGEAGGFPVRSASWVDAGTVRQALPRDAVLIDLVRLPVWDFQKQAQRSKWLPARYAAWVVPAQGQGQVRLIDLGSAAEIESAVATLRRAWRDAPAVVARQGERRAEEQLAGPLRALSALVLRPLLGQISTKGRWVLSPDASLWLVPWSALPLSDGSYAIEKHRISYVVSGRDLVHQPHAAATGRPLVLADPDFDCQPARGVPVDSPALGTRGLLSGTRLPRFRRLPGTAVEARAITPLLQRWTLNEPVLHTGKQALEGVFKAARRPRVVVLSTHGFFLDDQDEAIAPHILGQEARGLKLAGRERPRPRGAKVKVYENPLLRCGLALAGANQRAKAPANADDGILTGLEIVGTDLRGTELVVLSACETGLGQVNVGEGVAGLRQAFQLAGAQAVVATLWQVPDRETTVLMKSFFTHLAARAGRAEALRQAQLDLIKQRRAWGKAAHPFYWAAFTLSGDGR